MKYYSLKNILNKKCRYNLIFGERSNGKTYSVNEYGVKNYFKTGKKMAVIRRFREDFKGKRGGAYFDSLVYNGEGENKIKEWSGGKYDHVVYTSGKWYMSYFDEELEKNVIAPEPFAYAFSLTEMEHEKGNSYPDITTILFDEFMSRLYLPDEFVLFMNMLSTIIRQRNDVTIFMCANSIDMIGCPYFKEMGLKHVKEMKKGDIDVYEYGDSGLKLAIEYSDSPNISKPSDVYFAFDNKNLKLQMITSGAWELDIYPHITQTINKTDIIFSYFIIYDDQTLQADIVLKDKETFTYIHPKTTPIKYEDKDLIFTTEAHTLNNYMGKLTRPINKASKKLYWYFAVNKVFYSDNETGEVFHYTYTVLVFDLKRIYNDHKFP